MKNLYCRELLTENYQLLPIEQMKKKWNKSCQNKETLSGYPVYLFKDLKKLDKKYCVRPDQLSFFNRKNPYTNDTFYPQFGHNTTLPITEEYNNKLCPLTDLTSDDEYVFLATLLPFENITQLPTRISIVRYQPDFLYLETWKVAVILKINPSQIYSLFYYIMKIKKKIKPEQRTLNKNQIIKIYPLYKKQKSKTIIDKIDNKKLRTELQDYFTYAKKSFTDETLSLFRSWEIRLPKPIRAYRGILVHNLEDLKKAKMDKLTVGETFTFDSRGLPISWSTDSCLSQYFATHGAARRISGDSSIQFGVLYSCELKPQQIAIDTRLIDRNFFLDTLYDYDQQEIITFPYSKDKKLNEFRCVVERLFLIDDKKKRKTIVHSFAKILPLLFS
jgi:hypothetical protein